MAFQLEYRKVEGAPSYQYFNGAQYGHIVPSKNLHHDPGVFNDKDYLSDESVSYMQQQIIDNLAPIYGVRVLVDEERIRNIARNLSIQKNMTNSQIQNKTIDYICNDFRMDQLRITKSTEWERNFTLAQKSNPRYGTSQVDMSMIANSINTTPAGRNHRGTIKGGTKFFSLK